MFGTTNRAKISNEKAFVEITTTVDEEASWASFVEVKLGVISTEKDVVA